MSEFTQILRQAQTGDSGALGRAFAQVYAELRRLAAQRLATLQSGQTLTPTVLVHEVYEKLLRAEALSLQDRQHFFACAAQAMRQIVIDHARGHQADKRGGTWQRTDLDGNSGPVADSIDLIDIDLALNHLGEIDSELLKLVELRYFAGLGLDEIAQLRGTSRRTLNREWQRARALLQGLLAEIGDDR